MNTSQIEELGVELYQARVSEKSVAPLTGGFIDITINTLARHPC